jgi:hypothetical protein
VPGDPGPDPETGKIVAVCHVLRYAPYFVKLRELMLSGAIGRVVSVQHFEPIEHVHMAHSFVRGNWHDSRATAPIILAKSSHDLDMLRWLVDRPSRASRPSGTSPGSTRGTRRRGAPPLHGRLRGGGRVPLLGPEASTTGTGAGCTSSTSPTTGRSGGAILEYLRTTNYGRCVYRMDNDQCDHYVTNILFEDGVTASFSMEAFTPWGRRRTRVMGSMGYIEGDMNQMAVYDFRTGEREVIETRVLDVDQYAGSGHGGATGASWPTGWRRWPGRMPPS